jgi:hypothetical protein
VTLTGDPASISQVGSSLRRLAEQLRRDERRLRAALPADQPRGGAALVRARRRSDQLAATIERTVTQLDRVGAALQDHAQDLGEGVAVARTVGHRAESAGLTHRRGTVAPQWGVAGVADEGAASDQARARDDLQRELDTASTILSRRRHRLVQLLQESTEALGREADSLRG